ncbi:MULTISPECIES: primase C-terminal domain-containing protein [Paenibacillus]|uniref:primase C-terminal domain-containing protein n=1 Tax=Paenibacillus TaxID=44249 RepID=UPI001BCF999C|nr:primase C-terminal domain-containing protein [Paenibacillus dendritiformis]
MSICANSVYHNLYNKQLSPFPVFKKKPKPDQKDLGWVFLSSDCVHTSACRTYRTLFLMKDKHTYYTPNTFYSRQSRSQNALRWLNAIVIDVDVKNGQNEGVALPDLIDRVQESGLPMPSFVVKTPSGGFHVYFVLEEPRKAYRNVIATYRKLQLAMASALGGDRNAIGPERLFRIPTADNIIYSTLNRVSFRQLIDWYDINHDRAPESSKVVRYSQGLLQHAAVRKLLQGVDKGKRDNACYTLALVYKTEGFSAEKAEIALQQWNRALAAPLPSQVVSRKVRSAYKNGSPDGPSGEWIRYLSGEKFSYRVWDSAKSRAERKNSHYVERAADVLVTLGWKKRISGSQRELASMWGMSLSVFQHVTKILVEQNRIQMKVTGRGRAAQTILELVPKDKNVIPFPAKALNQINVPASNTHYLAGMAGGLVSWIYGGFPGLLRPLFWGPFP